LQLPQQQQQCGKLELLACFEGYNRLHESPWKRHLGINLLPPRLVWLLQARLLVPNTLLAVVGRATPAAGVELQIRQLHTSAAPAG
jgi:hypothetical protein